MPTADSIFGFILTKLLSKSEARSPAVVFPPTTGPTPSTPAPTTPSTPSTPAPTTPAVLPAPSFPAQVPAAPPSAGTPTAPAGFKKAVEIWIVQPALAKQAGAVLVGAPPEVAQAGAALTLQALESQFPKGWQGAKSATAAEAAQAKTLLAQWRDGGVMFMGPATLTGRRAFRMTKHPVKVVPTTAAPAPAAPSGPTVPASFPAPAAPAPAPAPAPSGPTTLPEVLVTADAPAPGGPQVTAVRKGEGLAQVAKRLGKAADQKSATELRAANLPGPSGDYTSQDLSKGGLKKAGRAGGLQPGDRLFVPPSWGPVDAARL